TLKELISQTMVRWSQEDQIQDPELVRIMYTLLRRQYDSIGELLQALRKAYTISATSVKDTINLLAALGQIRSLLSVRMGKEEELLMINGLGKVAETKVYLGHSAKMLDVSIFQIVFCISCTLCLCCGKPISRKVVSLATTEMFTANFPLQITESFRLEKTFKITKSNCKPSPAKSTPRPYVAAASVMDNNELALALEEPDLDKVVTYLAGCGLQSCPVLLAKGYPDIGWNPIEGERYLTFLRFAVFVN
ncbi:Ryanodine receptor 3, partial [Chlamydotis macqueenii]